MRRLRSTVASLTSLALALQAPLAAQAADSGTSDLAAQSCDRFAAPRLDTDYSGPREPISRVNRDQALEACRQAASAQPARGRYAYLYGRALWNGFQRYDEAVKQFAAAREAGNPWGALGLGTAYATGNGVAQDGGRAMRLYREAEGAGLKAAWQNIGGLYESGTGVAADANEAAKWYRRAADIGDINAYPGMMRLAFESTPVNLAEALAWARKAADAGWAEGEFALGWAYLTGSGVTKDEAAAARWYEKAARQGLTDAMYQLGVLYWTGSGVAKDVPAAFQWIRAAAEQGDPAAQYEAARMLYSGWGTSRDPKAAFALALQAARADVAPAQAMVGAMYYEGDGTARDHATAANWFRHAAL